MLKVTVELWPNGSSAESSVVAEGFVANDGTSKSDAIGNYDFAFHADGTYVSGRVEQFQRRLGTIELLTAAFQVVLRAATEKT